MNSQSLQNDPISAMKYALWSGSELLIGRDIHGLASHGAAVSVGIFTDEASARTEASLRGCQLFNGLPLHPG